MCSARCTATPPSRVGLAGKRVALQLKFARPARAKHDRRRAMGPGARLKSQSRLSRSRLDPAWSLQECRWAPYVRGHDPGQGQLPCESYRPPGQLLETHPAALLADTYVLLAKNQSTLRRGGPRVQHGGPPRAKCAKSGLCDGLGGDHLPWPRFSGSSRRRRNQQVWRPQRRRGSASAAGKLRLRRGWHRGLLHGDFRWVRSASARCRAKRSARRPCRRPAPGARRYPNLQR